MMLIPVDRSVLNKRAKYKGPASPIVADAMTTTISGDHVWCLHVLGNMPHKFEIMLWTNGKTWLKTILNCPFVIIVVDHLR